MVKLRGFLPADCEFDSIEFEVTFDDTIDSNVTISFVNGDSLTIPRSIVHELLK